MIDSTARSTGFGVTVATAFILVMAAPDNGHAEYRNAGHPAHVNALPHPPSSRAGTMVAAPVAQTQPHNAPLATVSALAPTALPVATGHTEDSSRAGASDRHDRGPRGPRIIVVGVPSTYYDGAPTYSAPGDYGNSVAGCTQYPSYDPRSGTYIGDDGKAHPCP